MRNVFNFVGDGWWPELNETCEYVGFGGGGVTAAPPTVRIVRLSDGVTLGQFSGAGLSWIGRYTFTFIQSTGPVTAIRFSGEIAPNGTLTVQQTNDNPSLVAGNEFGAANGHWASYLDLFKRLTVDGRPFLYNVRGIALTGTLLLTVDVARNQFLVVNASTLQTVRRVPFPATANQWDISNGGIISYGYWGPSMAIDTAGGVHDISVVPWGKEGVAKIVHLPNGEIWVASNSFQESTQKPLVALRPWGESHKGGKCIPLWDVAASHISFGYRQETNEIIIATCDDHGVLQVNGVDRSTSLEIIPSDEEPVIPRFTRKLVYAPFYQTTDLYKETVDFPRNAEVVVDTGASRVKSGLIVSDPKFVTDPTTVLALYAASEESSVTTDAACVAVRAAWRRQFPTYTVPPVVAYLTPFFPDRPGWPPKEPDIYSPQVYFETTPSIVELTSIMAIWDKVLPKTKDWWPSVQAYDRSRLSPEQMNELRMLTPEVVRRLSTRAWVKGILWFSVHRQGGVAFYPSLLSVHRKVFAALPVGLPSIPPGRPVDVPPSGGDDMKITISDYTPDIPAGGEMFVDFVLDSDVEVTELEMDIVNDGQPALVIRSDDLRRLHHVGFELPARGDNLKLQFRSKDKSGATDATDPNKRPVNAPK